MNEIKNIAKIQFRQDTSANWTRINPILAAGEPAIDLTNGEFKIGNGSDRWLDLPVVSSMNIISDVPDDGYEYLRTRASGEMSGSWVKKDYRKTINDLLSTPYDTELDMGFKTILPDSTEKEVFGLRKFFIVSTNQDVADTKLIAEGINTLVDYNGRIVLGDESQVSVYSSSPICQSNVILDKDGNVNITTLCDTDRLNNFIDMWILYTKK